jgi:hypothetical protein
MEGEREDGSARFEADSVEQTSRSEQARDVMIIVSVPRRVPVSYILLYCILR